MTPGDTHMHGLGRDDLLALPVRCGFEMVETNVMASVYGKGHGFAIRARNLKKDCIARQLRAGRHRPVRGQKENGTSDSVGRAQSARWNNRLSV
ncbi:hypothetical protein [Pseudoscardovia suis]|nr:hypothetical protein [Pseudoscardovia suis]